MGFGYEGPRQSCFVGAIRSPGVFCRGQKRYGWAWRATRVFHRVPRDYVGIFPRCAGIFSRDVQEFEVSPPMCRNFERARRRTSSITLRTASQTPRARGLLEHDARSRRLRTLGRGATLPRIGDREDQTDLRKRATPGPWPARPDVLRDSGGGHAISRRVRRRSVRCARCAGQRTGRGPLELSTARHKCRRGLKES
jgi:hypothetical protein